MTITLARTEGLQPRRLRLHFDSQLSADLRDYIERQRHQSFSDGQLLAVIVVDTQTSEDFLAEEERLRRLADRIEAGWAHEKAVGWIDEGRLCIALPSATAAEAADFADFISESTDLIDRSFQVYARDVRDNSRPGYYPIEELYTKATPTWKRTIDIIGSIFILIVTFPLLLFAALLIKLTSEGPVFFSQWRIGKGGRPFRILKLRTMLHGADNEKHLLREKNEQDGLGFKIKADPRVTPIGKLLRQTSIDELPQLLNVLRGNMSLVGPRPLPCNDWKPASGWICRRHDVVPGLTCTWQVSGRSHIKFDEWMQMDIDYIDQISPSTDLQLICRTVPAVLSQRGAS